MRSGVWTPTRYVGAELAGKTIGIIGFGTIGRLVAERAAGLKMRVLAYDPFVAPEDRNVDSTAEHGSRGAQYIIEMANQHATPDLPLVVITFAAAPERRTSDDWL